MEINGNMTVLHKFKHVRMFQDLDNAVTIIWEGGNQSLLACL